VLTTGIPWRQILEGIDELKADLVRHEDVMNVRCGAQ
jgi:hypothetical protein